MIAAGNLLNQHEPRNSLSGDGWLLELGYKEWSAVVDALGQGIQSVMMRTYKPRYSPFLLYPTFSYGTTSGAEQKFQQRYRQFANQSVEQTRKMAHEELLVQISYFAYVDQVIEVPKTKWKILEPYFMWSTDHILSYVNKPPGTLKGYLWILRVFELPKPCKFGRLSQGGPPAEYRHCEPVSIRDSKPILTDEQFATLKAEIVTRIND